MRRERKKRKFPALSNALINQHSRNGLSHSHLFCFNQIILLRRFFNWVCLTTKPASSPTGVIILKYQLTRKYIYVERRRGDIEIPVFYRGFRYEGFGCGVFDFLGDCALFSVESCHNYNELSGLQRSFCERTFREFH
jgi:hypothetical protein